jgi:hypothetical protein
VWRRGITIGNNYFRGRATIISVNLSDDLPNSPQLKVNDAVELLTSDTKFTPSRTQTTLCAVESCLARGGGQRSYFHADTVCRRPALSCRIDIL